MTPDEIHAKWAPGRLVRHREEGWVGTITGNRIYATDNGAYVAVDGRHVGVVHWSRLELTGGEDARPAV